MKRSVLAILPAMLALAWIASAQQAGSTAGASGAAKTMEQSGQDKVWEVFDLSELDERRQGTGRAYLEFLKVPTLRAGLYVLAAGAEDRQQPHDEDELYYIAAGKAVIRVGSEDQAVGPGSVVFVKAGVEHRFVRIEEQLRVLVFFSAARPGK